MNSSFDVKVLSQILWYSIFCTVSSDGEQLLYLSGPLAKLCDSFFYVCHVLVLQNKSRVTQIYVHVLGHTLSPTTLEMKPHPLPTYPTPRTPVESNHCMTHEGLHTAEFTQIRPFFVTNSLPSTEYFVFITVCFYMHV